MTKTQKIAVLCNYELLPARVGGMDYFFWDFDQKCKENNIEVDWFFPNKSNHGEYSNLTILQSNYTPLEHFFLKHAKENIVCYTHIISHFLELCTPFFKKLKQASNATVIVVDHNPRPLQGYPLKKKIEKRIKGVLFSKYTDVFVGVSEYTVSQIIKDFGGHLKNKTLIIYNGVVMEKILERTHRNTKKPSFLVASHLRESKGIQDLIDAVALLSETIKKELKIDIYGDGPYKRVLIDKIKKLKIEENFVFKGSCSNLKEVYSQYDYMLQPTHMECFSLSILESLAANVPVITTNVGGNEEVIVSGKNGFVFKAKDILALKDILEKVYLGNQKILTNTRGVVENTFSLQKMVGLYMALLSDTKI